jgi:25S rRNA (uracil2843-N3)-methyltransferase
MVGKKKASFRPKPKVNDYATIKKNQQKRKQAASALAKDNEAQDELDNKPALSDNDQKQQQRVLDIFRQAFSEALTSSTLTTTLQSVKQALYDRNFARAFGDPEHLEVYAARWSPTRALCYASVLERIKEHLEPLSDGDETETESTTDTQKPQNLRILSVGGGAAELVALGAFVNQNPSPLSGSITLLDSGPWETIIAKLTTALTTPPPVSKYASEAVKLSNAAMVPPSRLTTTFRQQDVLTFDKDSFPSLLGTTPLLVTILFTLNELFTTSGIGKPTTFLLNLTTTIPLGSLLLVVDSPGSYSETTVGKEAKRYPMHWLLDEILLRTKPENVNGRRWVKIESHESVWFRLASEGLDYPVALENMRYQMHLYRAEDASQQQEDDQESVISV